MIGCEFKRTHGRMIDPKVEGVNISLHYRTDNNDGNPARTFILRDIGVFRKSARRGRRKGPQLDAEGRKRQEDGWRAEHGREYIGPLMILVEAEELNFTIEKPLLRPRPQDEAYTASNADWLGMLQKNIDIGLCWKPSAEMGIQDPLFGEMRKEGKMWKWKPLSCDPADIRDSNAMAQYNRIQLPRIVET